MTKSIILRFAGSGIFSRLLSQTSLFFGSAIFKTGFSAGLLLAGFLASNSQVYAQPVMKQKYGEWAMACETPAGASSEQCALVQNIVSDNRPEIGLSVVVLKTADKKTELLRVLAPLGVLLPRGLGLSIDGKEIGNAYFTRCFNDGCYAEVVLEPKLLQALKAGQSAIFIVFQTPEEGIGIPVSLGGFTDGYNALK